MVYTYRKVATYLEAMLLLELIYGLDCTQKTKMCKQNNKTLKFY